MEGKKEGPLPNLSFLPMSDQSKQQQKKRKHRSDAPNPDVVDGAAATGGWARGEPRALGPGASAQPDTGWVGGAAGRILG